MKYKNIAIIDTDALRKNYDHVKRIVSADGCGPRVICVVKADAYGHGLATAVETFGAAGCDFFAVSSEAEALEVRQIEDRAQRRPEVLILGYIFPENAAEMAENDITCAVVSAEEAANLSESIEKAGAAKPLSVHIKLDTGMNRVGFSTDDDRLDETVREIVEISRNKNLKITGIFTHFSSADDELLDGRIIEDYNLYGGYTRMQLSRFTKAIEMLRLAGVDVGIVHAANSAAILKLPEAHFDAVRAGIMLYGYQPNGKVNGDFYPSMRFESTVVHIHKVKAGGRVSYGGDYKAKSDMTVATVSVGYGDGFERSYSGCCVVINGRKYRQIGRICMDQLMVDVTPASADEQAVCVGDVVTLFGGDDGESVNDLARRGGTINYEVLCKVSKRVPRIIK